MATTALTALPKTHAATITSAYRSYAAAWQGNSPTRQAKATRLGSLIKAAHLAGWPMQYLATLCDGISVRRLYTIREQYGTETLSRPVFPRGPDYHAHLTLEQAKELRELAPVARQHRGQRTRRAHVKVRSERFTALLIQHRNEGVTWAELSAATGRWRKWPVADTRRPIAGAIGQSGLQARVNRAAG